MALAIGVAVAEVPQRVSAAEARGLFLGVDLGGTLLDTGETWRECVEHDGRTVYDIRGARSYGRLQIAQSGQLCFTYEDDTARRHCFFAERVGQTLQLSAGTEGPRYRVERRQPVQSCAAVEAVS